MKSGPTTDKQTQKQPCTHTEETTDTIGNPKLSHATIIVNIAHYIQIKGISETRPISINRCIGKKVLT
jgi:hypothetical protein